MHDDSKLRLRKTTGAAATAAGLDCEEGGGAGGGSIAINVNSNSGHNVGNNSSNTNGGTNSNPGSAHHHLHHHHHPLHLLNQYHHPKGPTTASSGLSLPSLIDPPPMSYGQIKGRRKRQRRRQVCIKYCRLIISGLAAAVVWATLSFTLLPFSWTQVDYHHQVQHEFEYVYQVLEDNRRNYQSLMRGIHHHERQITCRAQRSIGFENDNYCDCMLDGSDEPMTPACSRVTVGQKTFQCTEDRNIWIFASRVGDGIEDCPGGSDERQTL